MKVAIIAALLFFVSAQQSQIEPLFRVKLIKPAVSDKLSFEDAFIQIQFIVSDSINFNLKNMTNNPIEIDWNKVSFLDTRARAHRVVNGGVRIVERDKPLAPTLIPPNASIFDVVHPSDYISYDSNKIEWEFTKILPGKRGQYEGETFGVYFPMKVGRNNKAYSFTFTIVRESPEETAKRYADKLKESNIDSKNLVQLKVSRGAMGINWPFKIEEGVLACAGKSIPAVFFITPEKIYAINGGAVGKFIDGKPATQDIDEIRAAGPQPGSLLTLIPLIDKGAALCAK